MELGTHYSRACCEIIAAEGGVSGLMRLIRVLNRSKPHLDLLIGVLNVLNSICHHQFLVPAVFCAEDSIAVLTERLQFFRDQEDVFMSAMAVLRKVLEYPGHALEVARMPNIIKQWEGIAQIILRKIDMEQKYIARLEGQKGSDYSAKEATRKVICGAKQLEALQSMISSVLAVANAHRIEVVHHNTLPFGCHQILPTGSVNLSQPPPMPEPSWVPKNTLVRYTLRDIQVRQQEQQLAALAAAAAAAEEESPRSPRSATKYLSAATVGVTEAAKREAELQQWQARQAAGKGSESSRSKNR
ncbi:hypothetical protein DUNSADRAFT_14021 [Dunaliella salina]|uniref:Uncharacterized protein n=1 Tax=Dunaliella salina TaxID=3046 RepID=A0ABQ7H2V9_DUNSA|nr:hypothetical protein DUNSADRAFT_14021 [Dunaliella salina]|eukprot:KAF5841190.1 hypothetical protein DUNSADRAFT_14021 [Dunaliella salina]